MNDVAVMEINNNYSILECLERLGNMLEIGTGGEGRFERRAVGRGEGRSVGRGEGSGEGRIKGSGEGQARGRFGHPTASDEDGHRLMESKVARYEQEVAELKAYLDVSTKQALLFAVIFNLTITEGHSSKQEIGKHLGVSPFEMLKAEQDLQELVAKKFLVLSDGIRRAKESSYFVPKSLIGLISKNEPAPKPKENMDIFELGEALVEVFRNYKNETLTTKAYLDELANYRQLYPQVGAFKTMGDLRMRMQEGEEIILLFAFAAFCIGEEEISLQDVLDHYVDKQQKRIATRMLFNKKTSVLLTEGILEFADGFFHDDRSLKFTQLYLDETFGEGAGNGIERSFYSGSCKLISPEEIVEKTMYYSDDMAGELEMLGGLLDEANYATIVEKLKGLGFTSGVTVMLHGYPGTGKTESVYQLARQHNRHILQVDISQIRNKYVGESEKKLKEVFSVYKNALTYFDKAPILLFNESDSLISKRTKVEDSVDQMNNTMQNILLQEMEQFTGILMATTNLIDNLDTAFDRRFFFKIKFDKPTVMTRKTMLKSKIASLTDEEAVRLAEAFAFSGGQVDNIARKVIMSGVLSNEPVDFDRIWHFCDEEVFARNGRGNVMGFKL